MNANSVWVGYEYAYVPIVRRKRFPTHTSRVKVLSKHEEQVSYKTRKDTFAMVNFLDKETEEVMRSNVKVNVRNLYDFWDSYCDERDARQHAAQIREEQRRREYEERMEVARRAEEERQRALEVEKERKATIARALAYRLSLDTEAVLVWGEDVRIAIKDLEFLVN